MKSPAVILNSTTMRWLNIAGVVVTLALGLIDPAFAGAGGFDKVEQNVNNVSTMFKAIAVVVVTCAIMWAGFKMLFQGARLTECGGILIGGTLIGGASALAAWIATPDA